MSLRSRLAPLLLLVAFAGLPAVLLAQTEAQGERIAASFVLALGRTPTPAETQDWAKQEPLSLADLVARHRQQLQNDAAAQRAVTVKASQDALGRAPAGSDLEAGSGGGTYAELMRSHLQWLAEHPADYEQVVHHAYRRLLQRDAYSIEIDYWKRQPALSFVLLVGCIEDWARRNQPGLMATTGTAAVSVNSAYLATVRLSPSVAAEARAIAGLVPAEGAAMASAAGRHLAAPGAGHVASVGGIHFTAAGAAGLTPVRPPD